MRRVLFFVLTLLTNSLSAQTPLAVPFDWEKKSCDDEIRCGRATRFTRVDHPEPFSLAPSQGYDLQRLNIFWDVTPTTGFIEGFITYQFKVVDALDTIFLDCADSLVIHNAWYDGLDITASIYRHDNVLAVALPSTLNPGSVDSIMLYYSGFPVSSGLGSYQHSGHNGDSIVATLSQPYGSRDWWPSKMSLTDKIDTVRIRIKVPEHYKAGSNGLLTHIDYMGSPFVVYNWLSTYPIATYLIAFAAYPYDEVTQHVLLDGDSLLVQHYIFPDAHDHLNDRMPALDTMLQIFTELFGPYPFMNEKYGHAQWKRGGGMEHQTMSFMSDFNHDLLAHELAHQWFGDKITCGSWSDIWLNEGFATYATGLTYERMVNGFWWKSYILTIRNALQDSMNSVFVTDTANVGRVFSQRTSYQKGAYILHSLRYTMGDAAFFAGLKDYATDTNLCYDFSRVHHFREIMEAHHGASLTEFFNDWYYGHGNPNLHLIWGQKGNAVKIISQQSFVAVNPTGFAFDMKVPVKFFGNGVDTIIDIQIHALTDIHDIQIPFAIDSITIDPDLWWLIKRKTTERRDLIMSENALAGGPNPVRDTWTLTTSNINNQIGRIDVFSVDGIKVYSLDRKHEPLAVVTLDVRSFAAGLYVVRVEMNGQFETLKLVKAP